MIHLPLIALSVCAFFSLFGLVLAVYNEVKTEAIEIMAVITFCFGLAVVVVS